RAAPVARREGGALGAAGKAELAPGLVHHYRHGIRQIQAAIARAHRQLEARFDGEFFDYFRGQSRRFRSENQHVAFRVAHIGIDFSRLRSENEHALAGKQLTTVFPMPMHLHAGQLVVIEAGALELPVLHRKAQRLDQMQACAGVRREPDHVAGVWRNLGLHEDDLKHGAGTFGQRANRPRTPHRRRTADSKGIRACYRFGMWTVAQLSADLAAGTITSRDLVEQALSRIAAPEGEGARAFLKLYTDTARAEAEFSDRLRRAGIRRSPVEGL